MSLPLTVAEIQADAAAYRICSRCVMDTTDPDISFDEHGVCSHCLLHDRLVKERVFDGEAGQRKLEAMVREIKDANRGKVYDCIIGVSGGVDSTYVAYLCKQLGLKPLAVHLDNGWNSELAVQNIEKTLKVLDIELYTHVINWEEFKDLQLAFLRASTPDSEVPSDHAIVSLMHQMARKTGIKHVLCGANIRTETHLPREWSQGKADWKYIRSVHAQFGSRKLTTYPHRTLLQDKLYTLTHDWIDVLNYASFVKKDAKALLMREMDWVDYGGKHYESIYTRFYQGYILPTKFGYDKRKPHLSALICSGELTREAALEELKQEPYPVEQQLEDRQYVIKKLGITDEEFERIMGLPKKSYWDYPSYASFRNGRLFTTVKKVYRRFKPETY